MLQRRSDYVIKGGTIKGKNMLPIEERICSPIGSEYGIGEHILSFKSSPMRIENILREKSLAIIYNGVSHR